MSKGSKVVFVAFIHHCIQSKVTQSCSCRKVESVFDVKLCLTPPKHTVRSTNVFTHNFLTYSTDFQSGKSFGKLRLRAFQPYHLILCMSKHVERVEGRKNFRPFRHASTYIGFGNMVGKL